MELVSFNVELERTRTMNTVEIDIEKLKNSLHELIQIVTDPSLWNFLSDSERTKISKILSNNL
jgi:hypothetical protein